MACNTEKSSSAVPEPAPKPVDPLFVDYGSMLKTTYLHHKETDAVIEYLEEREKKPLPANESATIVNFRAGMDNDMIHYSCLHDTETSGPQSLPDTSLPRAAAFQKNVEKIDDSVLVRFVLLSKASSGYRTVSAWIINYLGMYFELQPGFFYALIDADGDFMPEDNEARGGPFRPTTLYMEGRCFVICSAKRERRMTGSDWRPRSSESCICLRRIR